jgi:hypothetical protein
LNKNKMHPPGAGTADYLARLYSRSAQRKLILDRKGMCWDRAAASSRYALIDPAAVLARQCSRTCSDVGMSGSGATPAEALMAARAARRHRAKPSAARKHEDANVSNGLMR